jgi:hypothetical protein
MIPVTDEQAKALQEAFKLGNTGIGAVKDFAGYWAGVLGSAPEDLFGLLIGDRIKQCRFLNMNRLGAEAQRILEDRGVSQPEAVPLALALPLIECAADESREELVDLWARLLAAAMDPARARHVRQTFIDTVKKMDPLDARMLARIPEIRRGDDSAENAHVIGARLLSVSSDQADISLQRLIDLGCIRDRDARPGLRPTYVGRPVLSSYGSELLRVLSDEPS